MAIAATWVTVATNITTPAAVYTTPTTGYRRDLVVTNDGPATAYVAVTTDASTAGSVSSFAVPTGGSVLLTQCAVPTSSIVFVRAAQTGTVSVSVGWASNLNYV